MTRRRLWWVEFRDPALSERLLGAYVVAMNSLGIRLRWQSGTVESATPLYDVPEEDWSKFQPVHIHPPQPKDL